MQGNIHKLNNREMMQYSWQDLIFGGLVECASYQIPASAASNAYQLHVKSSCKHLGPSNKA
jgi:hypothetical protein